MLATPGGHIGGKGKNIMQTLAAVALVGVVSASCSSQSGITTTKELQRSLKSVTTTSTTAALTPAEQQVISDWTADEEYGYQLLQQPPGPARADLVAGEAPAEIWPNVKNYLVGTALYGELGFLGRVKMAMLNGPTSYDLGKPVVTSIAASSATITSCISDSGTTTQSGAPGPVLLDGNQDGITGANAIVNMQLVGQNWLIAAVNSKSVKKC